MGELRTGANCLPWNDWRRNPRARAGIDKLTASGASKPAPHAHAATALFQNSNARARRNQQSSGCRSAARFDRPGGNPSLATTSTSLKTQRVLGIARGLTGPLMADLRTTGKWVGLFPPPGVGAGELTTERGPSCGARVAHPISGLRRPPATGRDEARVQILPREERRRYGDRRGYSEYRASVADGCSPNSRRYSTEKRPSSRSPAPSAARLTADRAAGCDSSVSRACISRRLWK